MPSTQEQFHGHDVVIETDDDAPDTVAVTIGERRVVATLDEDHGWLCTTLPFRGYASPRALAEALALHHCGSEEG